MSRLLARYSARLARAPEPHNLSSMVCAAAEWNGGFRGRDGCGLLAMTPESVERVRRVWATAPEYRGPHGEAAPADDDTIG